MRYLLLPVVFVIVATSAAHAQALEDFSNISRAIGKEVSIVDRIGLVREGVLEAVTADAVTLRVGSATTQLERAVIASAERIKDDSSDGAIRGALLGLAIILVPNQGGFSFAGYWRGVALLAAVGYVADVTESNRQPLYRAPSASAPTLKVSWRF
jgi:hypothetical protein